MVRMLVSLCLALSLIHGAYAQEPPKVEQPVAAVAAPVTANVVPGLKLPNNFSVPYDEGFVTIKAECTGPVEWIVLTTAEKVKYKVTGKELDVAIPPKSCVITIFCYGVVDGKPTRAARVDIDVQGPQPPPGPGPVPPPIPVTGKLIVTVVEDPLKRDPQYQLITHWVASSAKIRQAGHTTFLKSIRDKAIQTWLDTAAKQNEQFRQALQLAGTPVVIIQSAENGRLLGAIPCPKTAEDLLRILAQGGGGQ